MKANFKIFKYLGKIYEIQPIFPGFNTISNTLWNIGNWVINYIV